ncbi:hypothetical protein ACVBEH_20060 [Roseateles sp. GG27B]
MSLRLLRSARWARSVPSCELLVPDGLLLELLLLLDDEPATAELSAFFSLLVKASASLALIALSPLVSAAFIKAFSKSFTSPAAFSWAETTPSALVSSGSMAAELLLVPEVADVADVADLLPS